MNHQNKKSSYYLRWLGFVAKHKRHLILAFVLSLVGMAANVALPRMVGYVIDNMLKDRIVQLKMANLPLLGEVALRQALLVMLSLLLVLLLLRSVSNYIRNVLLATVGEKVHIDIRLALFHHLQRLPLSYFDENYTGRIMAHITTDCDALWHLVNAGTVQLITPIITIIVVLVILLKTHVGLTICSMVVLPVFMYLYHGTRKRASKSGRAQRDALATIYSRLQERISGIRLIRAFGRENAENESFTEEMCDLYEHNLSMVKSYSGLSVKTQFITGAVTATILCFGGIAVMHASLSIGELVSFYLYVGMLFAPLTQLTGTAARVFTDAGVAMERIFKLLNLPVAQELQGPKRSCPKLRGCMQAREVSFSYDTEVEVLKKITFEVKEGETVALVGPSGGGKSTLVNLICCFYQPTHGTIEVDGYDISQFHVEDYRRQISYVAQDDFLFSGTVWDNLKFAKSDATRMEIEYAARSANAHEFIGQLPKGYDTDVGERGVKLSGGQKQRINLARALLREPAILILDEPTSALDAESESIILEALGTIFKNKTCFIIAHRLSTVMRADKILVIDKGSLIQQGNHQSLMNRDGLYRELCKKQFFGFGGSSGHIN